MLIQNGYKKEELHFWVMPNAGFATRRVLEPHIRDFEALYPDVKVQLAIHPWSLAWNRMMDTIKGRKTIPNPDVMQVGTTWVATLAYLGAIDKVPGPEVFPDDNQQSSYVWDPGAQTDTGEELFCVPWFIDIRVLYYRRDLFEKLGIPPEQLQDWKGFFKACTEIKRSLARSGPRPERLVAPLGMPGQKPGVQMHDLAPWIWAAGGDFFSHDLNQAILDSSQSITGCEFYYDLLNQGFMSIPEGEFDQRRLGNGFFSGHCAMQISGAWPIDSFFNPQWEYAYKEVVEGFDATLFPAGPQGRYSFLGGSNLAVSSQSGRKDLAWEFIRFLSEPKRQMDHARGIGALTARLSSLEPMFDQYPHIKRVFWDSVSHARRLPRLVELGSVEQIIYKMGNKLLTMIHQGSYNHKRLGLELADANAEMNAVLSLHRYGLTSKESAA